MTGAISRTSLRLGLALSALVALSAVPAAGQGSRVSGSVALLDTQPLGQLATGPGVGLAAAASWALDPARIFRVRGDFRVASYGYDNREVCLGGGVGCWIRVDVNTNYTFLYGGLGPEIAVPMPGFELLLVGSAGLARFAVESSLEGVDEHDEDFGDTVHFRDHVFGWSTGGEVRIPVSSRIAVSLGTYYHHNGTASYVPDGGISENPDGTLAIRARTTDANLVALTLGIGFRL
ncbi:MAG: hypothetical protein GWN71_32430 [Gammaproteobacteria bacterium]|nr:hypothetical protein [Gemmatimonadota bacterium]NIU78093.1 hypothetical protein [Gammaproteobacteria bacterium]NIW35329.1 hypothetical protein [Gemmatimonadota bacterium]NIY11491.1 hypothetical protein [Gemmatimonadota bacterium]